MRPVAILTLLFSLGTAAAPFTNAPKPRTDRDEADVYGNKATRNDRDEQVVYADVYADKAVRSDRDEQVVYADVYADKAVRSDRDEAVVYADIYSETPLS